MNHSNDTIKNILHDNIILSSLSSSISDDVKYASLCSTVMKNANSNKYIEVKIFLLLSKGNIHIMLSNLSLIKQSFSYDVISSLNISTKNENLIKINFDNEKLPLEKKGFKSIVLNVKDRNDLVKNLILYYGLYHIEKYGNITELQITSMDYIDYFVSNKQSISNDNEVQLPLEDFYLYKTRHGYQCYLYNGARIVGNDCFYYKENERRCTIKMIIYDTASNDNLYYHRDDDNIKNVLYKIVLHYMKERRYEVYSFVDMKYYVKKMNLSGGNSMWVGYRIDIRTAEEKRNRKEVKVEEKKEEKKEEEKKEEEESESSDESKEEKIIESTQREKGENDVKEREKVNNSYVNDNNNNISFIFIRKKYIPPFYDKYQDFLFILVDNYQEEFPLIYPKFNWIFETMVDSIFINEPLLTFNEYKRILLPKIEGLLLNDEELTYLFSTYGYIGTTSLIHGMNYVYKLIIIMLTNSSTFKPQYKDHLEDIKRSLWEKMTIKGKEEDSNYNKDSHEKTLLHLSIEEIIEAFYLVINTTGSIEYYNSNKGVWLRKVWNFISYCVNGGVTNNRLTFNILATIYENEKEKSVLFTVLTKQLINMMNIYIVDKNQNVLYPVISNKKKKKVKSFSTMKSILKLLTDNPSSILIFEYNSSLFNLMLSRCLLNTLFNSSKASSVIINFLLTFSFPSIELLRSIKKYIREMTKRGLESERNQLSCLLPVLLNIFSEYKKHPFSSIEASKILFELTISESDRNNKTFLLNKNILSIIGETILNQNEKIISLSLSLMNNILTEIKDNISTLIDNKNIIFNILYLFKGSHIPNVYYSNNTIILAMTCINKIIKNHTELTQNIINDIFSNDIHLLITNINSYIVNEIDSIGKWTDESLMSIQILIFSFLNVYISSNNKGKDLLFTENYVYNILFKFKSREILKIVNDIIDGKTDETSSQLIEIYLSLTYSLCSSGKRMTSMLEKKNEYATLINKIYKEHLKSSGLFNLFTVISDFKSNTKLIK